MNESAEIGTGCGGIQTTTRASTNAYAGVGEKVWGEGVKRRTREITEFTENHHWDGYIESMSNLGGEIHTYHTGPP